MQKKLYKSQTDKKWEGVCGGIAEYLNIDSTVIRLLWILFTVFSAAVGGLLAYLICSVVIPNPPGVS
jgi:phage shock protein PspC (stress-responsive transcriptional regulator)